ncbi:MAG: galactokinase family protein [Clostridia bacterium]
MDQERMLILTEKFKTAFGNKTAKFFCASGRIELCGNHTDHNYGKALVVTTKCNTLAYAAKTNNNYITILSDGYASIKVDINKTEIKQDEKFTSMALVKGIIQGFKDRDFQIGGFDAVINSTVFKGAGVSSSASFEILIAKIINDYYNNGNVTPLILAKIAQFAENMYFGKPCGLLDQCAIAFDGLNLLEFSENNVKVTPLPFIENNDKMILVNCGCHCDLNSEYISIKEDMLKVAKTLNKQYLGETEFSDFIQNFGEIYKKCGGKATLRALHFYNENIRVDIIVNAIKNNDYATMKQRIKESGDSSYKLLQNCIIDGDKVQVIATALAYANLIEPQSVCRVHGGGFLGTILCFVPKEKVEIFKNKMQIFGDVIEN